MNIRAAEDSGVKKRICMIAYTVYPTDSRVRREAEALTADNRFDITVLSLKENRVPKTYTKSNVRVTELNLEKYAGNKGLKYVTSYLMFLIKAFWACTILFFERGIDVVHVHNMPNFIVFAAIIPKLWGKPIILDMHDSVPDTFQAKFKGKEGSAFRLLCLEEKVSAWISDKVICVNHIQKEVTAGRGIPYDKIYIVMNVPDHRIFRQEANPKGSKVKKKETFKVVYHGTLTERLGIDLAIEAVTKLGSRIPGVELHLWGQADYQDVLSSRCKKLGAEKRIFFHGSVPIEALCGVLAEMDLGLIPNRKSAATDLMLPVKLMEYIALGIPVVAPKLKAIEYYFTDEMVSFFEPENVDAMSEAIFKIYQNGSRGKSQSEKAKGFLDQYGWEKQSQDFINFYLGV